MKRESFSWKQRGSSIYYAWTGMKGFFRSEHNARIHLAITIAVLLASLLFQISSLEWCLVIVAIAIVWMAEIFNTAIEKAMDQVSMERRPGIQLVKDLSAAAVLFGAAAALVIGCIIFIPKISLLW